MAKAQRTTQDGTYVCTYIVYVCPCYHYRRTRYHRCCVDCRLMPLVRLGPSDSPDVTPRSAHLCTRCHIAGWGRRHNRSPEAEIPHPDGFAPSRLTAVPGMAGSVRTDLLPRSIFTLYSDSVTPLTDQCFTLCMFMFCVVVLFMAFPGRAWQREASRDEAGGGPLAALPPLHRPFRRDTRAAALRGVTDRGPRDCRRSPKGHRPRQLFAEIRQAYVNGLHVTAHRILRIHNADSMASRPDGE
jgi:hypothetical protein